MESWVICPTFSSIVIFASKASIEGGVSIKLGISRAKVSIFGGTACLPGQKNAIYFFGEYSLGRL
ncbi:MAG: hypothetical protein AAFV25_17020, partial [Bacteroidota bacterium]